MQFWQFHHVLVDRKTEYKHCSSFVRVQGMKCSPEGFRL